MECNIFFVWEALDEQEVRTELFVIEIRWESMGNVGNHPSGEASVGNAIG